MEGHCKECGTIYGEECKCPDVNNSATKRHVIFRCGWCGYPVDKNGLYLDFIKDNDEANAYLEENKDADVEQVNGECCPNGDKDHAQQDYRCEE